MRRCAGLWLVIASLLVTSPAASASEVSDYDRFQLWHNCLPMDLIIEGLRKKDTDIELTEEEVTVSVRSRLRAARLYKDDSLFSYLYVNVHVVNQSFRIGFSYNKWLKDQMSGEEGFATTWSSSGLGMHGNDPSYILSNISHHADKFIDEYLRVNESACNGPTSSPRLGPIVKCADGTPPPCS